MSGGRFRMTCSIPDSDETRRFEGPSARCMALIVLVYKEEYCPLTHTPKELKC